MLLTIDLASFHKEFLPRIVESLDWFAPELQIILTALAILLLDLVIPRKASKHLAWLAVFGLVYATFSVFRLHTDTAELFLGMTATDSFARFFKLFFLLGGVPCVLLSYMARELEGRRMGEYYAILMAAILGGMLMASSNHLLMGFMSLELLSVSSYILVGYHRRSLVSSEASLKYIIYGSVAAAVMAYGLSILYGLSGSALFPDVLRAVQTRMQEGADFTVVLGLVLTFVGLAYKMATIPMHFWSPDVYEGAPTPITAFLSVASKAAGFALCMRLLTVVQIESDLTQASIVWPVFMIFVAMGTMTLGNLAALWQSNLKRLFAYSSIAHAGYMMMGVVLLDLPEANIGGVSFVSFYLLAYLAMNLGAFAVVILIENRTGSVEIDDYNGLGWKAPFLGVSLTVFLFSLVGIPPTAGFYGKFQLFMGVVKSAEAQEGTLRTLLYIMALVALANTTVSLYYYARIIRNMYLTKLQEGGEKLQVPMLGTVLVAALVALTFYLFFSADSIVQMTLELNIFAGATGT